MRKYWALLTPVLWFSPVWLSAVWFSTVEGGRLLAADAAPALAPLVRAYRAHPTPQTKAAVRAFAAAHPKQAPLADLALGISLFEQKNYAEAIPLLQSAAGKLPEIADYPTYYLAAAQVETKVNGGVTAEAAAVQATQPLSPMAGSSWVAEARGLEPTAPAEGARLLREHHTELPEPSGDLTLADCYRAANQDKEAVDAYRRIYVEYPTSEAGAKSDAALFALRNSMGNGFPAPQPAQILRRGDRLIELRSYTLARAEFEAAQTTLAGPPQELAEIRAAAARYLEGGVGGAYIALSALKPAEPEADAERLYWMEECARKLNNSEGQQEALKRLEEKYHRSPWRLKSLVAAASALLSTNRASDFVPLYQEVYEDFPTDPAAGLSHWRVAFQSYLHDKPSAVELLRDQLERYPTQANAGSTLYFLGRSAERKDDFASARAYYERLAQAFPNQYYALLARDHLRTAQIEQATPAPDCTQWCATLRLPAAKPILETPLPATTARIARSRVLREAGLTELADAELRFGARTDGQPALIAIELGTAAEEPHTGMHLMKSVTPDYLSLPIDQAPRKYWEGLFPMPFKQDMAAGAAAHDLDLYLVAGLIRQESEFDPHAISRAHADGLMQLLPTTARPFARQAGLQKFTGAMLFQPEINVKIGVAVLKSMLDHQHGKIEQTLAAYNAGPGRVTSWLTWFDYREPAEFVESIPITETREYVQGVLRNAEMYRRLYH